MSKSLQKITEERVYDCIFTLENELGIETNKLPEVYFLYKNFNFNGIGYNEGYEVKHNGAFFDIEKNIIFADTTDIRAIAEEAGHSIHYGFLKNKDNILDNFGGSTIAEMIGFFSSKLIRNDRISGYKNDFLSVDRDITDIIDAIKFCKDTGEYENLTHQQGYILGNTLYDSYISNIISKKEIVKLIKSPLDKEFEAFSKFVDLKYNILERKKF